MTPRARTVAPRLATRSAHVAARAASVPRARARAGQRGIGMVNLAIAFAVIGSLLAVAVPAFVRELHASRFAEPVRGLQRIGAAAVQYAGDRPASDAFPPPSPLTPPKVPRGAPEIDAPGTWDSPGWQALAFRPTEEGIAHSFSFSFDTSRAPGRSTFVAQAHGDLNGNGITSTFELRGKDFAEDGAPALEPGMYVESEVE